MHLFYNYSFLQGVRRSCAKRVVIRFVTKWSVLLFPFFSVIAGDYDRLDLTRLSHHSIAEMRRSVAISRKACNSHCERNAVKRGNPRERAGEKMVLSFSAIFRHTAEIITLTLIITDKNILALWAVMTGKRRRDSPSWRSGDVPQLIVVAISLVACNNVC